MFLAITLETCKSKMFNIHYCSFDLSIMFIGFIAEDYTPSKL